MPLKINIESMVSSAIDFEEILVFRVLQFLLTRIAIAAPNWGRLLWHCLYGRVVQDFFVVAHLSDLGEIKLWQLKLLKYKTKITKFHLLESSRI